MIFTNLHSKIFNKLNKLGINEISEEKYIKETKFPSKMEPSNKRALLSVRLFIKWGGGRVDEELIFVSGLLIISAQGSKFLKLKVIYFSYSSEFEWSRFYKFHVFLL